MCQTRDYNKFIMRKRIRYDREKEINKATIRLSILRA